LLDARRIEAAFVVDMHCVSSLSRFSNDYDGLFISPDFKSVAELTKGLAQALVLQDNSNSKHILVPNYGLTRVKVTACPFSTEVVFDCTEKWHRKVHAF
jgi:hypothetical protein